MPHYADGTLAQVGDIVKGRGYNQTKDKDIVGTVLDVRAGESCNLTVGYIEVGAPFVEPLSFSDFIRAEQAQIRTFGSPPKPLYIRHDYGDTKGFNKI